MLLSHVYVFAMNLCMTACRRVGEETERDWEKEIDWHLHTVRKCDSGGLFKCLFPGALQAKCTLVKCYRRFLHFLLVTLSSDLKMYGTPKWHLFTIVDVSIWNYQYQQFKLATSANVNKCHFGVVMSDVTDFSLSEAYKW